MNQKNKFTCKICGNNKDNNYFKIKEMHIGTFDSFEYFECSNCNCIQNVEIPENLEKYYPSSYYSFEERSVKKKKISLLINSIKNKIVGFYIGEKNIIGRVFAVFISNPFPWLNNIPVNFSSRILDVGCGTGRLLLSMQRAGFENLIGIDPYIQSDINYGNSLNIYKRNIFQTDGEFDLIMLHHSFEHMEQPKNVLKKLKSLLAKKGIILIRIPVTGGFAWRKYREHWVQLDAPRHFFLYSTESMQLLCDSADLKIRNVVYDSTIFQFTGSERYLRGITLSSNIFPFSKEEIRKFTRETARLNKLEDGDAACFYINH
jgi:SAM-dependent methyltransferase